MTGFNMAKDDKKYQELMNQYKTNRVKMGQQANKFLDAALKLREEGDVSEDVVKGMAYL